MVYVNVANMLKLCRSGDAMVGELNMNGYALKKLPKVAQSGTDACSAAYVQGIRNECVNRDGGQGKRANLDMGGKSIIKVQMPTNV